jgi:hypothetical protein
MGRFRAAFKDADVTFRMSGNDLELSVLAGSLLSEIFEKQAEGADRGCLGLLCLFRMGVSKLNWVEPFINNAETYLDRRLRTLRKQGEVATAKLDTKLLKSQVETFVTKLAENAPPQTSEAAKALLESLLLSLSTATEAATGAFAELQRQSILRKEETDVLSWLTAAVSRDAGTTFAHLKTPAASLIAGKELADLVRSPGILAARSILQGVIPSVKGKGAEQSITLLSAVNATDRAWRQRAIQETGMNTVADLCPVLGALKTSLTTDDPGEWVGTYRKEYDIDPNAAFPPADLSFQIYRECLLAKS